MADHVPTASQRLLLDAFDAVIFDMDGLLFDTERVSRQATLVAADAFGFAMSDEFYATLIGVPGRDCDVLLRAQYGPQFPMPEFYEAYRVEVTRLLADGVPVKSGAAELLRFFAERRMPKALATSSGRITAERHLQRAGLRDFFDIVATRDDVERGKPFPDLFLKAARDLDKRPQRCLVLEDSYNGIRAAHAAGCVPVMIPDLLPPTDEMRGICVRIVDNLHDVRALFEMTGA